MNGDGNENVCNPWVMVVPVIILAMALVTIIIGPCLSRYPTIDLEGVEGYQCLEDIPQRYLDLVPGITKKVVYACAGTLPREVNEQDIRLLLNRFSSHGLFDTRMIPFYQSLIESPSWGHSVRHTAMYRIAEMANHYHCYSLLKHYLGHPEEWIRIEARRCLLNLGVTPR